MLDPYAISRLYRNVLKQEIDNNCVLDKQIQTAIKKMYVVYSPETTDFESNVQEIADYNDVAYRCAYLHKYAPMHTYIVCDAMTTILKLEKLLFRELLKNLRGEPFEMCCLGGGPGSDVIGVLAALQSEFAHFKSSATVIDSMENWKFTFTSVFHELVVGKGYGRAWKKLAELFKWEYIGANLLRGLSDDVHHTIASSSLVTMVKFVSAAACRNTEYMVEIIFRIMKPGALLLFIDNAGGGFSQLIEKIAQANGLTTLLGPLQHVHYSQQAFKVSRFGFTSCYSTTVTIILLQKQIPQLSKRKPEISRNNSADETTPLLHGEKKRKTSCLKQEVTRVPNSRSTPLTPNAENIPKLHRNLRPEEAILEQNEKLSSQNVHQPTNPGHLPKLNIKQDIIFQNSNLKSNPFVYGRNFAVDNSLTVPQSASVETINKAPASSNPDATRNKLDNLENSGYVSSKPSKSNSKDQGSSFKTSLLLVPQKEDKEVTNFWRSAPLSPNAENIPKLHRNFRHKEAILEQIENLSWRNGHQLTNPGQLPKLNIKPDITIQHPKLKSSPSVSSRNFAVDNSLTAPQSASIGMSKNAPVCSHPVATGNKLDNMGKYEYASSKQSKSNTKEQGVSLKTPLLLVSQNEDRKSGNSLMEKQMEKKMQSTSTSNSTLKNSQRVIVKTNVDQKKGTLGTESSKCFPVRNSRTNHSSITNQPVSSAGPSHETESSRSKLNATQNGVDHTEVQICCPCCVPSPTPNLPRERSNSPEEEVCCPSCVLS